MKEQSYKNACDWLGDPWARKLTQCPVPIKHWGAASVAGVIRITGRHLK